MLQINFCPESDKKEYIIAAREYTNIWKRNQKKIITLIEKYSNLTFKTTIINATTYEGISYSSPMRLRSSYSKNQKLAVLVHELLHRLLIDNNFWFNKDLNIRTLEIHKLIYLILFDIWCDLLGNGAALKEKEREIGYGNRVYKEAWEWALAFSKEQRTIEFKQMKEKYQRKAS